MEELSGTGALVREILEDARKKAERALKGAETEIASLAKAAEAETAKVLVAKEAVLDAELRKAGAEAEGKLPLERLRARTRRMDEELRRAVTTKLASLEPPRAEAILSREFGRMLALAPEGRIDLSYRGMEEAMAKRIASASMPAGRSLGSLSRLGEGGVGVEARSADDSFVARASLEAIGEGLMDRYREELSSALMPSGSAS